MNAPASHRPRITVVGSLNMDLVVRTPRMVRPGETVLGGPFYAAPGGKGANQAVAAARLGAEVCMVGRVGEDAFAGELLLLMRDAGVDCRGVAPTRGTATGVGMIVVEEETGQNAIVVASGANMHLTPQDVREAEPMLANADLLVVQLEIPLETVSCAIDLAVDHGVRTLLNPAPARPLPDEVLAKVEVLVPNEIEAAMLVGAEATQAMDASWRGRTLVRRGPRIVVVTLGAKGALLVAGDTVELVPSFSVTPVDTTAAGDAFIGALAVALAEGRPLREAVRWANAAGALATSVRGAMPSLPTRDAVDRLAREGISHHEAP